MKNSLAVFCGAVMFCALAVSHAQTPGRQMGDPGNKPQPGTMSAQQHTQQMMGSQMMNRDQLRQMSTMMEQMNRLMQDMNRVSQQQQTMDQTRQRDMAQVMDHMSDNLRIMARDMRQDKLSDMDREQLQTRMKEMTRLMDQIQQPATP